MSRVIKTINNSIVNSQIKIVNNQPKNNLINSLLINKPNYINQLSPLLTPKSKLLLEVYFNRINKNQ